MKYKSKRGTVINIPDGLTAKQIAAIKADADSGYGTRAQQTANQLGKKLATTQQTNQGTSQGEKTQADLTGVVNENTGTINPVKALGAVTEAEAGDIKKNVGLLNPDETDALGNTKKITYGPDGNPIVTITGGALSKVVTNKAEEMAKGYIDPNTLRKQGEEAAYNTLTRFYDRDQSREMEEAKQELANRGIPYDPAAANDPNTKNLYGKTIGNIGQRYQTLKDQAAQQAILSGNQIVATQSGVQSTGLNDFITAATSTSGNFNPYQGTTTDASQDAKDIIALSADAYMKKYGIDQDTYTKKLAASKSGSSSGSSGGQDNSPIISGGAPGWGV
jgi:hypothetical protein